MNLPVWIDYDDPLVSKLISRSLSRHINLTLSLSASDASLQWSSYESISFETIIAKPKTTLCNTYIFRKALIRKHFLATTVQTWITKHPDSVLVDTVPRTYLLECDYADYLDEALNESFELRQALELNETSKETQYFILKPSMADRGQGIRLFSRLDELQEIFNEFEQEDDEDSDVESNENGVIAGQLRHFVVQEYISRPLLLDSLRPNRKFHLRVYVVVFGAMKVWVWSEILALFAARTFESPTTHRGELDRHLSNTCLQDRSTKHDNVLGFWSLPLSNDQLQGIFNSICSISGEIFTAAAVSQQMHFRVPYLPRRTVN